jgi:hypothetical protein
MSDGGPVRGCSAPDPRPWLERLLDRIFPQQPFPDWPNDNSYTLRTETRIQLGWSDRARVALTGRLSVKTQTITDVMVKTARSESSVSVLR